MSVEDEISSYLASIPKPRQSDMRRLHAAVLEMEPGRRLWFFDGKDEAGKVVSNPSIGYGALTMRTGTAVTAIYTTGESVYGFALTRPSEPVCN